MEFLYVRTRGKKRFSFWPLGLILATSMLFIGCQSMYYAGMEKMGYHKRDLMVSDVEKARDAQQEAKEQFKSALDRFTILNII